MRTIAKMCGVLCVMALLSCGSGNTNEGYSGDTAGLNDRPRPEDSITSSVADGNRPTGDSLRQTSSPVDNTSADDTTGNPITR